MTSAKSLVLAACLAIVGMPASAASDLGRVDFPTSGAPAAREPFLRGVAALHRFWYDEAADAFREAQKADPGFAMAYWGEAMTYHHPIWGEQDREAEFRRLPRRSRVLANLMGALAVALIVAAIYFVFIAPRL